MKAIHKTWGPIMDIAICNTTAVEQEDIQATLEGAKRIVKEVRSRLPIKYLGTLHSEIPLGNADECQRRSMVRLEKGKGEPAVEFLEIIKSLEANKDRLFVMVIDQTLFSLGYDKDGEFADFLKLGGAIYPNSVVSVKSMPAERELRRMYLQITAAHELLHNFGLVNRSSNYIETHCNQEAGDCLMGEGGNIADRAKKLMHRKNWLCRDCLSEAQTKKKDTEDRGLVW